MMPKVPGSGDPVQPNTINNQKWLPGAVHKKNDALLERFFEASTVQVGQAEELPFKRYQDYYGTSQQRQTYQNRYP